MARIFVYEGKEYPDPDSSMSTNDVRESWVNYFPELSNAETKETKRGEDTLITFTKRAGTKGAKYTVEVEIPDGKYCWDEEIGGGGCPFLYDDGLGDYACQLQRKPGLDGQYSGKLPKYGDCPSLKNQPEKIEGTLSDERG